MDQFGDRPLDPDDRPLERTTIPEPGVEATRPAGRYLAVIALVGLAAGAAAAWWWAHAQRSPAPAATVSPQSTDAIVPAPSDPARTLPPLGQMDTFLRALIGGLSAHPDVVRWLSTDGLIQQMANGVDRVSRGQTPARELPAFRPDGEFRIVRRGRNITIDPESFRRYDVLAALVQSLDARAVADAYRTIRPRLDEAYRGLGRAEGGVDDAMRVALQQLIDTPLPAEPIAVVPGRGATYAFADPKFEGLTGAQKQLLRMGPANAERVQARLREFKRALETP
jgi:hypothetical protein